MKTKTLIGIAVASTFGWSAASYAGNTHSVVTPFSPNESGEVIFSYEKGFSDSTAPIGALSDYGSGAVSGSSDSLSYSSSITGSGADTAALGMDESLAASDEGLYSDYYLVTWTPVAVETWDYYVIDDCGSQQLVVLSDSDVWLPATHELALVPSASDEMIYELVVVPTMIGDTTASLPEGSFNEAAGE